MPNRSHLRIFALAIVALATTALLVTVQEPPVEAAPGCTDSDLSGSYAFVAQGNNPLGEPIGIIGSFTADGAGNLTGFNVQNENGVRDASGFSCTYTMSPSCFFTGPCLGAGDVIPEVRFDGVLADGKKEIEMLLSSYPDVAGGGMATGVAHKQ